MASEWVVIRVDVNSADLRRCKRRSKLSSIDAIVTADPKDRCAKRQRLGRCRVITHKDHGVSMRGEAGHEPPRQSMRDPRLERPNEQQIVATGGLAEAASAMALVGRTHYEHDIAATSPRLPVGGASGCGETVVAAVPSHDVDLVEPRIAPFPIAAEMHVVGSDSTG